MTTPLPASVPGQRRNWTRRLVNLLVALVVVAVAAATFVFSYEGVHAIALVGGVSKQLARYYPGLFDAVLVIACVAAVMLREARWWARVWAWVVIFILLAAIGMTDVLHAMDYTLRHRPTEGIVAAAPVVAVLLAFSLLLTLLRQSRTSSQSQSQSLEPAAWPVEVAALQAAAPPMALTAAPEDAAPEDAPTESLPAVDEYPHGDLASTVGIPLLAPVPPAPSRGIRYADIDVDDGQYAGLVYSARDDQREPEVAQPDTDGDNAAAAPEADKAAPELDDDAPPFATAPFAAISRLNRVRSTPTPPTSEDDE
ncbi:MAG: DUF2637 domain-containing protein [Trebonia sp.]